MFLCSSAVLQFSLRKFWFDVDVGESHLSSCRVMYLPSPVKSYLFMWSYYQEGPSQIWCSNCTLYNYIGDKYFKMITLLIDQNWLWIKFPRASLISEFLGNIFVGIWAQNWIWSKTFPSSIFCDSPSMDPWPRALCRNKGFFNYSLSQAPKFNSALTFGSRICEWRQMRFVEVEHCLDKWVRWISDER